MRKYGSLNIPAILIGITGIGHENLAFIVRNYLWHGYRPDITLDLVEPVLFQVPDVSGDLDYVFTTRVIDDDAVLRVACPVLVRGSDTTRTSPQT